jgi:molecular chaperone DnaK (HSP70)
MSDKELIVGIDLGTTNSEIAAMVGDRPRVLGPGSKMLPSCVAISPSGQLLVGQSARNQLLLYPELTVRSVKRKMGTDEKIVLGDKMFSPQEISALILRELAEWAARELDRPVKKAVVTVPAYFSDVQRQATREAGELAGLEVVRILNEPTAASLAYGLDQGKRRTVMIYDLGGGTFDVSVVTMEGDVTEVLASHGNNHLGGDDFDQLLLERLLESFRTQHGIDLKDAHPASYSRLRWAAEDAKKRLSFEPYVMVREEGLAVVDGQPLHLEEELSRSEYEDMIRPLVESTLDSVARAMDDARKTPDQLDTVLLVGGSTRTPLVWRVLENRLGFPPRQDVHPDLCVALGSGVLASRLAGHDIQRVLVDVSPYSFGPSHLGERDGRLYPYCYRPIITRNTPLPITRTESYYTAEPYQTEVDIDIFQGDDPDALKDVPVGHFHIGGLTRTAGQNEVLCRMSLDLDGILKVTAIEKRTGKSKYITITGAMKPKTDADIAAARARLSGLYGLRGEDFAQAFAADDSGNWPEPEAGTAVALPFPNEPGAAARQDATDPSAQGARAEAGPSPAVAEEVRNLVSRSRAVLDRVHDEDKEEMIDLHERIEQAIRHQDLAALFAAAAELKELLFFIEGK